MKSLLMIAGAAVLLASATLPAAADGPGRGDHDRSISPWHRYIDDDRDDDDWRRRQRPYPYWLGYGDACRGGWQGWHDRSWRGGYGYYPRARLPKPVIAHCVRQLRFGRIRDIDFDDGFYKVHARDPYGRKVRLLVDPYTGSIVRVRYR